IVCVGLVPPPPRSHWRRGSAASSRLTRRRPRGCNPGAERRLPCGVPAPWTRPVDFYNNLATNARKSRTVPSAGSYPVVVVPFEPFPNSFERSSKV
ncbi:hypothetical protein GWI33_021239, partial [Rhynchophorus ferrugineus]